MKGVRFQKTRAGVLIDITCVCGCSFMINETSGLKRSYRHSVRLSKNGTSIFFRCEKCDREYEVRSEYDHIHVEEVEDDLDQSVDLSENLKETFAL